MATRPSTCDFCLRRRHCQVVGPERRQVDQGTFPACATERDSSHSSMVSSETFFTSSVNHDPNSYPVSPDVGKVGNESPTFIEPISKRKDGILAMFAGQGSQKSKSSSPVKRRRSTSPPPAKKLKTANVKGESDSEIEFVGYRESIPKVGGTPFGRSGDGIKHSSRTNLHLRSRSSPRYFGTI